MISGDSSLSQDAALIFGDPSKRSEMLESGVVPLLLECAADLLLCICCRAHALLTDLEKLEIGEADHVAGSQWPLLLLVSSLFLVRHTACQTHHRIRAMWSCAGTV